MSFVIHSCKTGKCWNQSVLTNFDSDPLICDPTLFPGKNCPNIAKNNRVFLGKGKEDRALILTYLNSPMAEVFLHYSLSFSISAIFKGKRVIKGGPKVRTWMKTRILQIFLEECFCLLEYCLWWEFWQYYIIFGGVRAQKPPKKERGTQNFKNF